MDDSGAPFLEILLEIVKTKKKCQSMYFLVSVTSPLLESRWRYLFLILQ